MSKRKHDLVAVCGYCARRAGWGTIGTAQEFGSVVMRGKCHVCDCPIGIHTAAGTRQIDRKAADKVRGQ